MPSSTRISAALLLVLLAASSALYLIAMEDAIYERGVRLAFLGQCNRTGRQWNYQPFLDAGYDKPGFAYLLPDNLEKAIDYSRDLADVVVVQTHSGDEYETAPPPDGAPFLRPPPVEELHPGPDAPEFRFRVEPSPGERELRRHVSRLDLDRLLERGPRPRPK